MWKGVLFEMSKVIYGEARITYVVYNIERLIVRSWSHQEYYKIKDPTDPREDEVEEVLSN